jgi:Na+/proline symporter
MMGEKILGLPYEWGVIIIAAVFIFYTAIGGMWSITLTDLFQGMVMLFVLTLAGILCFANFGSPTELYANAVSLRPQWSTNTSATYPWLALFGGFMTWVFVHSCLPHTIMRVFTAEDEKSGRLGLSFGSFLISAFALLALVYITGAAVIVNGGSDLESYDYVFMTVIDSIFPTWFQAITYAGVFAAVMSSVSGMLLSIGSAASFDLVQALKPDTPEKTVRKLSVWSIVVFGLLPPF